MSSSGDSGIPAPDLENEGETLTWAAERINEGWGIRKFAKVFIGTIVGGTAALSLGMLQAVQSFITTPLETGGEVVAGLFSAFIGGASDVVDAGASETSGALGSALEGFMSLFAFPIAIALALLGLWVLMIYIQERTTSDIFPGSFTDVTVPDWVPFIGEVGAAEEGESERTQ